MKLETIFAVVQKYDQNADLRSYHDDCDKFAIVADWNKSELSKVEDYLNRHHRDVDLVFEDSVSYCSDCGHLITTQVSSYGWTP